ncbi:CdaR family transcriptional regulator [Anaerocolumna sp. MB42-C2]|uniref:CdaR family transcriptional regulator n=1 Tax=Anaerocolumna sp. MB42-C2 TaxID=3070997 RepID=UPI0027DECF24|nr:sugar diacid recognition domain-containing protein [Anaerocolumna sp. MB42-C2]WMJ86256.1 sugar diacid recognition domain-containing protein [Anaerocolumna sp. MB42-C2]
MLDSVFAQRFIEKIRKYTDYNINIMDEKGIIIASRTESRIGTFHEIAYRIIHGEEDEIIVENDNQFVGVKAGINAAFFYKNNKIGVIGITGEPSEIRPISLIIRMSMETMLEYEIYKEERYQRRNIKEQFLNLILYGENVTEEELGEYAQRLNFKEELIRIPILIRFNEKSDQAEQILSGIRERHLTSSQDISGVTRNNCIIIFKHFDGKLLELLQTYKIFIGESLSRILQYLKTNHIDYKLYTGSFQNKFAQYRISYLHCKWLFENTKPVKNSYFFYDYLQEYLHSLIPLTELNGIFEIFKTQFDDKFINNYIEIVSALDSTDYNLAEASKYIHIHKNTMSYRLDKLRKALGMNPLLRHQERIFFTNFYDYLVKTKK